MVGVRAIGATHVSGARQGPKAIAPLALRESGHHVPMVGVRAFRAGPKLLARRTLDLFEIPGHRGSLRSAGVGNSIAGNPADGAIIDDPFGKREDADSPVMRQRVWDWYANDLYPRLSANAWIVLTHTRWHRDDLAGRLLRKMAGRSADKWEVLCLPAVREEGPADPCDHRAARRAALARLQVGGRPRHHSPAGRSGLRRVVPAEPGRRLGGRVGPGILRRLDVGRAGPVAAEIRFSGGLRRCQQGPQRQAGGLLGHRLHGREGPAALRERPAGADPLEPDRPQDDRLLRRDAAERGGDRGRAVPGVADLRVPAAMRRKACRVPLAASTDGDAGACRRSRASGG